MTINFIHNKIEDNFSDFKKEIEEVILNIHTKKVIKFKTKKGVFGIHYEKKNEVYLLTYNGHEIERVMNKADALEGILSLYKGINI